MVTKLTKGERVFTVFNYIFLGILATISLFPLLNILATSFSSAYAASAGQVGIWPVDFNINAYKFVANNDVFFSTFFVSIKRVLLGVPINMVVISLAAYALSVPKEQFKYRSIFAWFFMFSMIFSGGLIPLLLTVEKVGIIDSIWALVLPLAAPVYYVIILMNFFRAIPQSVREAAAIDGAGHFRTLAQIYIPMSKPAIATITLLCFVLHWNSWFDGLLYINNPANYPLQSYLQTMLVGRMDVSQIARNPEQWKLYSLVTERTIKCAQIFLATIPIMCIYPYLSRNFTKGMTLGAVKE